VESQTLRCSPHACSNRRAFAMGPPGWHLSAKSPRHAYLPIMTLHDSMAKRALPRHVGGSDQWRDRAFFAPERRPAYDFIEVVHPATTIELNLRYVNTVTSSQIGHGSVVSCTIATCIPLARPGAVVLQPYGRSGYTAPILRV